MPYWNRPRELTRSMEAYSKQYPDLQMEFSICDDGSIHELTDVPAERVKITRLPQHLNALNPCVPINVAIRQASNDVIVLTNPEVEHREGVLWSMLQKLQGPNDYVMAGCIEATTGARIAGEGTPLAPAGGRLPIPPGSDLHFCVMFHRELFERVGGFDESYRTGLGCDDNDFVWSLHAAGANFIRVPHDVYHYRTPHRWTGTLEKNAAILNKKWGHLPEFKTCA